MPGQSDSLEAILMTDNRDVQSEWSVVWSTGQLPGIDSAAAVSRRKMLGRRRLRIGSLALGSFLSMHCAVTAPALTGGGYFLFIIFFTISMVLLGNSFRHFEVYLGQWSLSGPGRAFKIIALLDGIGVAICIHALVRAVCCCCMASMSAVYVMHSFSDARLPFTHCRDFDLKPYEPLVTNLTSTNHSDHHPEIENFIEDVINLNTSGTLLDGFNGSAYTAINRDFDLKPYEPLVTNLTSTNHSDHHPEIENFIEDVINLNTSGTLVDGLNGSAYTAIKRVGRTKIIKFSEPRKSCKEKYKGLYPSLYHTLSPAYNFFYVEVARYRDEDTSSSINVPSLITIFVIWLILWFVMIYERLAHGRLTWNNMYSWLIIIPWFWTIVLLFIAIVHLATTKNLSIKGFANNNFVYTLTDAFVLALYLHSAGTGTEIIYGKGLNHYANGHIDQKLNQENVVHTSLLILLVALHSGAASVCTMVDHADINKERTLHYLHQSTIWILPLYSKCIQVGSSSHILATLVFGGLTFSYIAVAYLLVKTALHGIFEYSIKLVYKEQLVVAILVLSCMAMSLTISNAGGIALLESVELMMIGIGMPFLCLLELVALMYLYRSRDFMSDMNVATEDSLCSWRIGLSWKVMPFVILATLIMKIVLAAMSVLPQQQLVVSVAPLAAVVLAVPARALFNWSLYLRNKRRPSRRA